MKPGTSLPRGTVVQINPEAHDGFFRGCLMVVTEPKSFGAMGYIAMPGQRGDMPGLAYYRAEWNEMEFVGLAAWIAGGEDGETP